MHPLTPLDPPLHVAVVRSVGLITVVGRLTVVVCVLDASTEAKCGPGPQFTPSPVRKSAVHIFSDIVVFPGLSGQLLITTLVKTVHAPG